ncbi:MAG: hypothetical protein GY937_24980 [bacterium]|nr:hypothetical protein [bacterium]
MQNRIRGLGLGIILVSLILAAPMWAGSIPFQGTFSVDILDNLFVIEAEGSGVAYRHPDTGVVELDPGEFVVENFGGEFGPETPRDIIPPVVERALNNYVTGGSRFAPREDGTVGGPMAIEGTFDFLGADDVLLMSILLDPMGVGGTATTSNLDGLITTLTTGMEWTTGTVFAEHVIAGGLEDQVVSRTGFDRRDADGFGAIRLVTASEMTIDGSSAGFFVRVPTFATLDLVFSPPGSITVPEPSALALLALSGLALARATRLR